MKSEVLKYKKKYQNKWVAKDPVTSEVIESDVKLESLVNKMEETKTDYILEKVLPLKQAFIH